MFGILPISRYTKKGNNRSVTSGEGTCETKPEAAATPPKEETQTFARDIEQGAKGGMKDHTAEVPAGEAVDPLI